MHLYKQTAHGVLTSGANRSEVDSYRQTTAPREALPVCSILLGFLFAGFWWTLNQEFSFMAEDRHFRLGIALLLLAMVMLGVFGVVLPIRQIVFRNPFLLGYRGVVLALVTVFGTC